MIVLDNCVPRRYVRLLQNWGFTAVLLHEHLPQDATDPEVIDMATRLDAVLLTIDLDFANILDYPPDNYRGIIVLRYQIEDQDDLDATLKVTLDDLYREDLRGKLVIVSPQRYRVRG
jgi:predicted nuclease of predicted toxin-antitoxin system